jgi:putative endonuclease
MNEKFPTYTVYVLTGDGGLIYKGVTNNLSRRIAEHKSGHTITTSKMSGLRLVYSEEYDNFVEARKRELYFKSAAGRRFLKNKLPK